MANFTDNTTQLQNLLVKVNELPEAGSGSSVETCTVTITSDVVEIGDVYYSKVNKDGGLEYIKMIVKDTSLTFSAASGTIFVICNSNFTAMNTFANSINCKPVGTTSRQNVVNPVYIHANAVTASIHILNEMM